MEKVIILVDAQNIYYTTKQAHNCNFDYNEFWAEVTKNRNVMKAIAYTTERGDEKQRQFQNILRAIGFEVKLKPYIQRSDGSAKGDWDVGITLDAMEYAKGADLVALASGDGDFDLLVTKIQTDYKTTHSQSFYAFFFWHTLWNSPRLENYCTFIKVFWHFQSEIPVQISSIVLLHYEFS